MEQVTLHTARLLLRPVEPADQQKVYEGFSHPDVTRYFDITYPTFESTAVQMEWYANNRKENTGYAWVVCDKHSKEFMGVFSLYYINTRHQRAELGYWLLPPYWNKGYATEILNEILHHAKTSLNLHRIAAEVEQDNTASIELLKKIGFERDGTLRDYEIKNGKFQHLEIWSIIL
ncbi:MAG: GNAT family N-acetyltransferase [Bacteroidia bacterium]|nr:GNAT family N-acetyltransferase [Bacteroidia bacterium]MBP7260834.1 GNAT family N-acetyltransferase [Bacteroidia bacterium]MBP9179047.1 GNAT family N-acetyltransferase [Bacteroidia bacterium]MBP9724462.1 GNAT family N-acetyltransferase [Bacteroidia bacterium]